MYARKLLFGTFVQTRIQLFSEVITRTHFIQSEGLVWKWEWLNFNEIMDTLMSRKRTKSCREVVCPDLLYRQ